MHVRLEIFLAVVALLNAVGILELLRRRRLKEKYALLWLIVGTGVVLLAAFRPLVDRVARLVGVSYGPAIVFLMAVVFLLFVCVHLSTEVSRLEERTTELAAEIAIMRAEQEAGARALIDLEAARRSGDPALRSGDPRIQSTTTP